MNATAATITEGSRVWITGTGKRGTVVEISRPTGALLVVAVDGDRERTLNRCQLSPVTRRA